MILLNLPLTIAHQAFAAKPAVRACAYVVWLRRIVHWRPGRGDG